MTESHSANEVRAQYDAALPQPLVALLYGLEKELMWLHLKWYDFRKLYANTQETITLLNAAAPDFFYNLHYMMWDDVLLHLCRITDKTKVSGKKTLTVRSISTHIPDETFSKTVEAQVTDACEKTKFARDRRNRRIAHCELPPLKGEMHKPLAGASRKKVEDALTSLRNTMNIVEYRYCGKKVRYEHSIEALGGVESLLSRLQLGVDTRRVELERRHGN